MIGIRWIVLFFLAGVIASIIGWILMLPLLFAAGILIAGCTGAELHFRTVDR